MIVTLLTVALIVVLGMLTVVYLNYREMRDDNARWQLMHSEEIKRHNAAAFRLGDEIAGLERVVEAKNAELARQAAALKAAEAECRRLEKAVIDRHCTCNDSDAKHQQAVAFVRDIARRIGAFLPTVASPEDLPFG